MFAKNDPNPETIPARYYGDLPRGICKKEFTFPDDPDFSAIEGVEVFIGQVYAPQDVEIYRAWYGDGYKIKGGKIISGEIDVAYGSGYPYTLFVMDDHCGQTGFRLAKPDSGSPWYVEYVSDGFDFHPWGKQWRRKIIDDETIEKIFSKIEKEDVYGEFARECAKTARRIWKEPCV